jgi:hypothetical protein
MSFVKKAFGAVTNMLGITGDVPSGSQTQTGYFPGNVNIDLPLYSARQTASGRTISNKAKFSSEGQRIEELLRNISGDKAEELKEFIAGGGDEMIAREQRLFEEAASPGISRARNLLRDQVTAGTGGLFTTPGGQQALGVFEADVSADKAGRNLQAIDRAEGRRKLLESEETSTLNNLVSYMNMPQVAAAMALQTGSAAAAGNQASAAMVYQNEQNNRAATGSFLNTLLGGFFGTQPSQTPTPQAPAPVHIGGGPGTQTGMPLGFQTSASPFSSNRPQYSGSAYNPYLQQANVGHSFYNR